MKKADFLKKLEYCLDALPKEDINRSLNYYEEIILDRMEDGLSEEEAVAAIGSIDDVVHQILFETPITKLIKRKVSKIKRGTLGITLIILGSPIWISLLAAFLVLFISAYTVIFSLVVTYYAVGISVIALGIVGIVLFFPLLFSGSAAAGVLHLGIGVFATGLGIIVIGTIKPVTKAAVILSKKIILGIKLCFIKKS